MSWLVHSVPASPQFVFTKVGDPLEVRALDFCQDCDPSGIQMTTAGVAWVHDVGQNVGLVSPVCSDFHPGLDDANPITTNCPCICNATAARSCQQHDCDRLCLDLAIPPVDGTGALPLSNVEPRSGRINDIEIDLDAAPAGVAVASVDCTDNGGTTTSHLADLATTTLNGSTVNVTFNPALPDEQVCVITLDCGASICVRGLLGDLDRDGAMNTGDASQMRFFFNQTACTAGGQWDYDQIQGVTTGDASQIRFFFNNVVPTCP